MHWVFNMCEKFVLLDTWSFLHGVWNSTAFHMMFFSVQNSIFVTLWKKLTNLWRLCLCTQLWAGLLPRLPSNGCKTLKFDNGLLWGVVKNEKFSWRTCLCFGRYFLGFGAMFRALFLKWCARNSTWQNYYNFVFLSKHVKRCMCDLDKQLLRRKSKQWTSGVQNFMLMCLCLSSRAWSLVFGTLCEMFISMKSKLIFMDYTRKSKDA